MGAKKMKMSREELLTVLGIMVKNHDNYVSRVRFTPAGAWFEFRNAKSGGKNSMMATIYNVGECDDFAGHAIATREWRRIMESLAGDWVWITTNGEDGPIFIDDEAGHTITVEPLEI